MFPLIARTLLHRSLSVCVIWATTQVNWNRWSCKGIVEPFCNVRISQEIIVEVGK